MENIGIFTFARGFFADDKRLFTVRKNARAFSLHFQCKPTVCLQKRSSGPDSAVIFQYVIRENMLQGQVTKNQQNLFKTSLFTTNYKPQGGKMDRLYNNFFLYGQNGCNVTI